jgi:hypothetical protein
VPYRYMSGLLSLVLQSRHRHAILGTGVSDIMWGLARFWWTKTDLQMLVPGADRLFMPQWRLPCYAASLCSVGLQAYCNAETASSLITSPCNRILKSLLLEGPGLQPI